MMKKLRWPINSEQAQYMEMRKQQNLVIAKRNPNENWMYEKLQTTGYNWSRQSKWGYRLFDFWCHYLGIAIEVDGNSHNKRYDKIRDEYNYNCSGILVLRVRNKNEDDAKRIMDIIKASTDNWNDRRINLGLKPFKRFVNPIYLNKQKKPNKNL